MAITTKKMRLRTSKRNNKPKTPKRKNNKSYTKKRNSAIKGKRNSRRVRKQRGGEISDANLLKNIKRDFDEEQYMNKETKTFNLDLAMMLTMCMSYINTNFWKLTDNNSIKAEYSANRDKIFNLFEQYIDFLEESNIVVIELCIYINNMETSFNYTNFSNSPLYDTEFITNLLFNIVIKNLLLKKINFKLIINDDLTIPFTQSLNIQLITNSINKMPFDFHFKNLLKTKLTELDIIGFGFNSTLPNTETDDTAQFPNE